MKFHHFAFASAAFAALVVPAFADTTVTLLHVSDNASMRTLWEKIAKDYETQHPGVKVQVKYLENEAFKAKLPTMLQSDNSRCESLSLGGGVVDSRAG